MKRPSLSIRVPVALVGGLGLWSGPGVIFNFADETPNFLVPDNTDNTGKSFPFPIQIQEDPIGQKSNNLDLLSVKFQFAFLR